jgi:hypothetical protein
LTIVLFSGTLLGNRSLRKNIDKNLELMIGTVYHGHE